MQKRLKILIGISILFLCLGIVTASQYDDLKGINGYEDMIAGISENLDNKDIYFYVGEMEVNKGIFDNTTGVTVIEINDTEIYTFVDTDLDCCGVQEKVMLDGKEYLVSIVDESGINGNLDEYYKSLEEFNKVNNLVPLEV